MDLSFSDKTVVVTGAGSGVGAAIARAFCREGANTVFTDIDEEGLSRAVSGFGDLGMGMVCNVADKQSVRQLFQRIDESYGGLQVLINAAAINTADYIENIQDSELERVLEVNVKGYIHTTMEAIPRMKKAGFGRLIYINSGSGLKASAGMSLYSASKYFDRGFAISAALELGRFNITANSICPSDIYPIMTPDGEDGLRPKSWLTESLLRVSLEKENVDSLEDLMQKRISGNPMRRSCTTEDVANLVLFLASERAGFINGQSIGLNGGALPY